MRRLNKKQINFIKAWFNKLWTEVGSVCTIDQMSEPEQKQLQAMNDHETLWSNADRLINDLALEEIYK